MKRDKLLILSVIILVLLNLFSLAMLWLTRTPPEPVVERIRNKPDVDRGNRFLYRTLDLSPHQRSQVAGIQREHADAMRELKKQHQQLRRAYIDVALNHPYNTARGDSLLNKMAQVNGQIQKETWGLFRQVYGLCNPHQQQKYRQLMLDMNRRQAKRNL